MAKIPSVEGAEFNQDAARLRMRMRGAIEWVKAAEKRAKPFRYDPKGDYELKAAEAGLVDVIREIGSCCNYDMECIDDMTSPVWREAGIQ